MGSGRQVSELPRERTSAGGHGIPRRHEDQAVAPSAVEPSAGRREADLADLAGGGASREGDPRRRRSLAGRQGATYARDHRSRSDARSLHEDFLEENAKTVSCYLTARHDIDKKG